MILSDKRGMKSYELIEGLRELATGFLSRENAHHINEICDELRMRIGIEKLHHTRLKGDTCKPSSEKANSNSLSPR